MKKFLVSILAIFYLTSSMGATVHFHFCMGKLVEWGLGNKNASDEPCSYCGVLKPTNGSHCMAQANGCCKYEQKHLKIEKDQKFDTQNFSLAKLLLPLNINPTQVDFFAVDIAATFLSSPFAHAPPTVRNVPLFIRNHVFRI